MLKIFSSRNVTAYIADDEKKMLIFASVYIISAKMTSLKKKQKTSTIVSGDGFDDSSIASQPSDLH